MRIVREVVRKRTILGREMEMQVIQIKTTDQWQATYYHGADDIICGDTSPTRDGAIESCDETAKKHFGITKPMKLIEKKRLQWINMTRFCEVYDDNGVTRVFVNGHEKTGGALQEVLSEMAKC